MELDARVVSAARRERENRMESRRSVQSFFPERMRRGLEIPIGSALKRTLAQGYDKAALRADLLAGLVVGIVALPLSMALAISVGVPPQHGIYTAIVAGIVVALAGGSKFQVTGPTAAFVVILAPITSRHGLSGLLTAGLMAGILLVAMGLARLGRLIQFIPHPVTTGFTAGIATVIATLQLKDVFGLPIAHMPETYLEKVLALWHAKGHASLPDTVVAGFTLLLLIVLPRRFPDFSRRVPAPLLAIGGVSVLAFGVRHFLPGIELATIGSRFQSTVGGEIIAGIPALPPTPVLPWGDGGISLGALSNLGSAAFAIAMLGAIESLLSAVIADGMTGKKHDPDSELVALGLGNIVAPFFGGIAATGALARTATNVRSGARSPFAAVAHSVVILLAVLLLSRLLAFVPMASLAALLLIVAWNMSERHHFTTMLRIAPKSDVVVLLVCFALTIFFDMVVAVSFGVVLASLLFMKRTAELTHSRLLDGGKSGESEYDIPPGVALYEVAGPLFFGAAQNAMGALQTIDPSTKVVVLALGRVPSIDATGLVALESALTRLHAKTQVVIAGPLPEPRQIFDKANLPKHHEHLHFTPTLETAFERARELLALAAEQEPRSRRSGPHSSPAPVE
jgi:SulP family sulfate permease